MSVSAPITVAILVAMIILGLLPKIPVWIKIPLQLIVGAGIYIGMSDAMFALPYGDNLPISDLFGGNGGEPGFNKLSMGVVSGGLGTLSSLLGFAIWKLVAKRGGGDE